MKYVITYQIPGEAGARHAGPYTKEDADMFARGLSCIAKNINVAPAEEPRPQKKAWYKRLSEEFDAQP